MSNLVLAGERELNQQTFDYKALAAAGVQVIKGYAMDVDGPAKVMLRGGERVEYDRLVLAPGVQLNFDQLSGYSRKCSGHASCLQAGAQTTLLRRRLQAMPEMDWR